jgi:hypothetical protein
MPRIGRGQKEGHRIVPIPPLDKAVLDAGKDRVTVRPAGWDRKVIDDVEDRDGDDRGDVKPKRDVEGRLISTSERPEKVNGKHHPNHGHHDVDGPDQLRVFLSASQTEGQSDRRANDDELPTPKMKRREEVRSHPRLAESLSRIVNPAEHHVPDEGKDDSIGVQWTETPETEPGG